MGTEEKQQTIFEQNCEDFRSLNEIMWKIPIIVITLTGGLWFGVGSMNISNDAKTYLLVLAGAANVIFILVLIRLRFVMNQILKDIKAYQVKSMGWGYIFVGLFSLLLAFSAVVSFYAACKGAVFFTKGKNAVIEITSEKTTEKLSRNPSFNTSNTIEKTLEKSVTAEKAEKTGR